MDFGRLHLFDMSGHSGRVPAMAAERQRAVSHRYSRGMQKNVSYVNSIYYLAQVTKSPVQMNAPYSAAEFSN